jgi:hypothetical protein
MKILYHTILPSNLNHIGFLEVYEELMYCHFALPFLPQYLKKKKKKKLHGLSPRANYTDRATAASRRSVANLCG